MNNKVNYDGMKKAYDGLLSTFVAKNKDYGNSFEQSMDTHGLVASIVRMEDKFNRLKSLAGREKDALVASESLSDTLLDLANYAVMTAVYLEGEKSTLTTVLSTDGGDFTVSDRFFKRHIDTDLKLVERNAVVNQKDLLDNIVAGKVNAKDIKVKDVEDRVIDKPTISFEDSVRMMTTKPEGPELTLVPRFPNGHMYGPYVIFVNVTLLYYPGASIKVDRHDGHGVKSYPFIVHRQSFTGVDTLFLFENLETIVYVLNNYANGYGGTLFEFLRKHDIPNVVYFKKDSKTNDIFKQIDLHHTLASEFERPEDEGDIYKVGPTNMRVITRTRVESNENGKFIVIHGTLSDNSNHYIDASRNFIFFEDTGEVLMSQENLMPTFDNGNNINGVIKAKCDFSGSYAEQIKQIYKREE